jgi:DNA-binding LacI/PurR family transcriptional regulator
MCCLGRAGCTGLIATDECEPRRGEHDHDRNDAERDLQRCDIGQRAGTSPSPCARANDTAEAEQLTATLLRTSAGPPDAIAAMSDQQAAGVIRALHAAGRVTPDDVAVTGCDDAAVAAQIGLTTVAQSLREQGAACANAALGQQPDDLTAAWSIIRRASTRE